MQADGQADMTKLRVTSHNFMIAPTKPLTHKPIIFPVAILKLSFQEDFPFKKAIIPSSFRKCVMKVPLQFVFGAAAPQWARAISCTRFLDHTP